MQGTARQGRVASWRLVAALLFPSIALLSAPGHASETTVDESKYVGSEKCVECHEDQVDALKLTQHGSAAFTNLSTHGCETCHGPSKDHVDHPRDVKLQPSIAKLTVEQQTATCRACHSGGKQALWEGSAHQHRGVSCLDCHSVHQPKSESAQLRTEEETETCFGCHKEVRSEMRKTSHHPVREGKMSCTDCHNPHGTTTAKNIIKASINEQCYTCHAEKRGPFLWEHAPVREDCTTCHTPHGSNHAKLQRSAVPYLCQQCHSNTRHPGTVYDATTLPGAAKASNRLDNRGCVNCHAAIHGSNHPSGPYLGR